MSREEDLEILYTSPPLDPKIVAFNSIAQPCPLLSLLSIQDVYELNRIAKDKKLNTEPRKKLNMIKDIMGKRGFKKLASGTNRIVFKFMENQSFVVKVAYDSVGLSDNLCEIYNQHFLKPFCTKVFEVSPCGTVGMFERVRLIKNREEFFSISSEIYDIIIMELLGKYVIADFGSKFFMNWGIRQGMHPVLLDFPYCYELDGAKLYCNAPNPETGCCGGEIDYDDGFNHLFCTKCGKQYQASELKLSIEGKSNSIMVEKEDLGMIIEIIKNGEVVRSTDTTKSSNTYRKKETPYEYRQRRKMKGLVVEIIKGDPTEGESVDNRKTEQKEPDRKEVSIDIMNTQNPEPKISNDQFNNGWSSREVPSVDMLYKDIDIEVIKGDPKEKKSKWKGTINVDTDTNSIQWPNSQQTFSEPVKDAETIQSSDTVDDMIEKDKEEVLINMITKSYDNIIGNDMQQPEPLTDNDIAPESEEKYSRAKELLEIEYSDEVSDYEEDNISHEVEPEYNEDPDVSEIVVSENVIGEYY